MVASAIGESELAVLAAFSVLDDRGLATPHYGVYCASSNSPIEVFDTRDQIPAELPCEVCDAEHRTDDKSMWVEVFFTVDVDKLHDAEMVAA
jgi:hypothetical protein